jgi:hypothetical protein
LPTVSDAFSNRPQHELVYTVNASTPSNGATTTFSWSFSIETFNNLNQPFGTGSYNNTAPNTDYLDGTNNNSQSFGYDYRNPNRNRRYTFSGGRRTAPAGTGNRTFSLNVSMGSLIGSAFASISIPTGPAPQPPAPPPVAADGAISVVNRASNSITVGWFTTENPTSAEVRRDGTLLSTSLNDLNFVDAGRTPDTQFTYTLVVRKTGFPDATDSVVTRTRRVAPTLAITATALTSTSASVSWTSTNADTVSITGPGISSTDLTGSVTVTGLSPSTVYRWDGTASNVDSLDSASQTVTVQSNSIQTPATVGGVWNSATWAFPTVRVYSAEAGDWVAGRVFVRNASNVWQRWV